MGLTAAFVLMPFLALTDVSLEREVPPPLARAPAPPSAAAVHESRKQFLIGTFRRILRLENPQTPLEDGASRKAADHLLPFGVLLNQSDPCATDVADRQLEKFGRIAGYDSIHWAWFPEDKKARSTGYTMYLITKMRLGDVRAYLTDDEFLTGVAQEMGAAGTLYDGYLSQREIALVRTQCAGFDLYRLELS